MPRGQLDRDELKCHILKLKYQVDTDEGYHGEKQIAHKYLNKVLDKIEEYRYWEKNVFTKQRFVSFKKI